MLKKLPKSLVEFQRMFPDETACADYIRALRWPSGFVCPHCGGYQGRQESQRPLLWGCRACGPLNVMSVLGSVVRPWL